MVGTLSGDMGSTPRHWEAYAGVSTVSLSGSFESTVTNHTYASYLHL